ncbi:hypothetical protein [Roseicella frigidaeris]|uniref:hypothetical protein n=1 Tax=Roseicella frigidaeris TaxID=2230885 RepID=UPI001A9FE0FC|nr:hypothetical protein [Roseicella frigidaeris]
MDPKLVRPRGEADIKRVGFWSARHEARADLCRLLGYLYPLIVGSGRSSLDARLARRSTEAACASSLADDRSALS